MYARYVLKQSYSPDQTNRILPVNNLPTLYKFIKEKNKISIFADSVFVKYKYRTELVELFECFEATCNYNYYLDPDIFFCFPVRCIYRWSQTLANIATLFHNIFEIHFKGLLSTTRSNYFILIFSLSDMESFFSTIVVSHTSTLDNIKKICRVIDPLLFVENPYIVKSLRQKI